MLDTSFFNMLILFFKVFFYSAGMEEAVIDLVEDGQCVAAFAYRQGEYRLTITPMSEGVEFADEAISVDTIDNAWYSVTIPGGDQFNVDLAPLYEVIDWSSLTTGNMEIPGEETFYMSQGKDNIYLSNERGRTLVLSRNYLP